MGIITNRKELIAAGVYDEVVNLHNYGFRVNSSCGFISSTYYEQGVGRLFCSTCTVDPKAFAEHGTESNFRTDLRSCAEKVIEESIKFFNNKFKK